jgi:hypothetical protein
VLGSPGMNWPVELTNTESKWTGMALSFVVLEFVAGSVRVPPGTQQILTSV